MKIYPRLLLLLLFTAPLTNVQAQAVGTLFTTPGERMQLDELRRQYMREQAGGFDIDQEIAPPTQPEAAPPPQILFHLSGIMSRSDGTRTIWLNGEAMTAEALPEGFSLTEDGRGLRISTRDNTHTLYPGQTIDLQSGSREEAFETDDNRQTEDENGAPTGP